MDTKLGFACHLVLVAKVKINNLLLCSSMIFLRHLNLKKSLNLSKNFKRSFLFDVFLTD